MGVLIEQLGIRGATIDGHFVRVEGKLARYRLHLGTAAVHIEPGHHLCIVPDRSLASRQSIYLPFAEGPDPKGAELLSKMFLLLSDDQITDASILGQIKAAQGEGRQSG